MITNGDVLREKLSNASNEDLSTIINSVDIMNLLSINFCNDCEEHNLTCIECKLRFLSQSYEEPKRWYLHRYSTSLGKETYIMNFTNKDRFSNSYIENLKNLYTFEEACKIRTELNKNRENKKNLWLLGDVKE